MKKLFKKFIVLTMVGTISMTIIQPVNVKAATLKDFDKGGNELYDSKDVWKVRVEMSDQTGGSAILTGVGATFAERKKDLIKNVLKFIAYNVATTAYNRAEAAFLRQVEAYKNSNYNLYIKFDSYGNISTKPWNKNVILEPYSFDDELVDK